MKHYQSHETHNHNHHPPPIPYSILWDGAKEKDMKQHDLKTWPEYFYRVFAGQKKFEVRKNDRDFQIGDLVHLIEYDPVQQIETGRDLYMTITYVLPGGQFGIEAGYCVFGLA